MRQGGTKSIFRNFSELDEKLLYLGIIGLEGFPAPSSPLLEGNPVYSGTERLGEMSPDSISA